jgi:hypothetical protein
MGACMGAHRQSCVLPSASTPGMCAVGQRRIMVKDALGIAVNTGIVQWVSTADMDGTAKHTTRGVWGWGLDSVVRPGGQAFR